MTNTEQEDIPEAVSEQMEVSSEEHQEAVQEEVQEEQKMVPLAALQAERKKRQEMETRNRVYEEMMSRQPTQQEEPIEEDDPEELVTKGSYRQEKALTKREILEQVYQDAKPEAVQEINEYLKPILDKKPWLAASVDNATNRLSRAFEIVQDYKHLVNGKPRQSSSNDAQRIVQNSQKPRSPVEVGKSAQPTGTEYLKSIQGKKEFREYRQKVLRGEA